MCQDKSKFPDLWAFLLIFPDFCRFSLTFLKNSPFSRFSRFSLTAMHPVLSEGKSPIRHSKYSVILSEITLLQTAFSAILPTELSEGKSTAKMLKRHCLGVKKSIVDILFKFFQFSILINCWLYLTHPLIKKDVPCINETLYWNILV